MDDARLSQLPEEAQERIREFQARLNEIVDAVPEMTVDQIAESGRRMREVLHRGKEIYRSRGERSAEAWIASMRQAEADCGYRRNESVVRALLMGKSMRAKVEREKNL